MQAKYTGKQPYHATEYSAGYDLYADTVKLFTVDKYLHIRYITGLRVELPIGFFGLICPRSSVVNYQLQFIGPGVIDSDYRGQIGVDYIISGFTAGQHINDSRFFDYVYNEYKIYNIGDRVGQIIVMPCVNNIEWIKVDSLTPSKRGDNGYGSTGV